MVWYWIVYPCGAGSNPVFPGILIMWDRAAVARQFHALNVEGSNPSPTIYTR